MVNYELTNVHIISTTGLLLIETYIEIRRAIWLEKILNMKGSRIHQKLLGAWLPYIQRNS